MFSDKLRQYFPEWRILIKVILELLQLCYERVPTTFGNTDREHDEE